ncbi:MAG TPA: phytoene/squalene synthase family protein [Alphaproteobacteria bacterium]|nr:phytoene/squalene synthase family protein [Alphaproteobacteria bacterium]
MAQRQLSYCAAEVRRYDPDRFLTALFAPRERREDLFALYAFNLEVAKTREVASEPLLGRIRLEWWRETIEAIYAGEPRRHAVALPLAELILRERLTRAHFDRLIEAREQDFEETPPASLAALESYAAGTSASLVALALETLGVRSEAAAAPAHSLGVGWALAGLLRAVPFHARQRRLYLPGDLMAAAGVEASELFENRSTRGLATVVSRIAERAELHLAALTREREVLPRRAVPALLPAVLARAHLAALRRAGHDPFALKERRKHPLDTLRVAAAALSGRY